MGNSFIPVVAINSIRKKAPITIPMRDIANIKVKTTALAIKSLIHAPIAEIIAYPSIVTCFWEISTSTPCLKKPLSIFFARWRKASRYFSRFRTIFLENPSMILRYGNNAANKCQKNHFSSKHHEIGGLLLH